MNMYAYVRGDPINATDPLGLCSDDGQPSYPGDDCTIVVTGKKEIVVSGDGGDASNWDWGWGYASSKQQAIDAFEAALGEVVDALNTLSGTGTAHAPKPGPKSTDLRKIEDRDANTVARHHGYDDAHDAKAGRGGSRVNIYYDRANGRFYLWDGHSPEKEPL